MKREIYLALNGKEATFVEKNNIHLYLLNNNLKESDVDFYKTNYTVKNKTCYFNLGGGSSAKIEEGVCEFKYSSTVSQVIKLSEEEVKNFNKFLELYNK